jgi:hypothetical protein
VHLIESSKLLKFDNATIERMNSANDEDCEAIFLKKISLGYGGAVDWRAKSREVIETIDHFLTPEERSRLSTIRLNTSLSPPAIVKAVGDWIGDNRVGARTLDSFGDFFFVLLIPKELLAAFDKINRHWLS